MTGVRGGSGRRYYRCSNRTAGACDAAGIRADIAEEAFAAWLGSYELPKDWRAAIARAPLGAVRSGEQDRQTVLAERLKRLRDLYSWGDLSDEEYRAQASEVRSQLGIMAKPDMVGLEAVADALRDLGAAWRHATAETRAALPPLMLKAAEVVDGGLTWVVHAELRPLLDLCVSADGSPDTSVQDYTVRYSA
jgi:hypothetical protein